MEQQELEALYHRQLRPALDAFARGTSDRVGQLARRAAVLAPVGVLTSILLYQQFSHEELALAPFALVFAYLSISYLRLRRGYREQFKSEVIAPILEQVDGRLRYEPEASITREEFAASSLFDAAPDEFDGEDLVTGRVDETLLRFSEVRARSRSGEGATLFKGFFIVAEFPAPFRGSTVVLPDTDEPLLRHIAHTLQPAAVPPGAVVYLAHPEFERLFAVHTDEEHEARLLLSPAVVERIVRFRKRTGQTLCVSACGRHIYVAIPSQRDRFEPPDRIALHNLEGAPRVERMLLENLQAYIDDLRFGIDLITEIDRNGELWTAR